MANGVKHGGPSGYTRDRGAESQEQKPFEHEGSWPAGAKQRYAAWNREVKEWRAETQDHPYFKRDEPVQVPYYSYNNPNGTIASYGEGWENGYHVYRTAKNGDKFVDSGKIEGFSIGQRVTDDGYHGKGTVVSAIITSSPEVARKLGRVAFTVNHDDGSTTVLRPSDKRYKKL